MGYSPKGPKESDTTELASLCVGSFVYVTTFQSQNNFTEYLLAASIYNQGHEAQCTWEAGGSTGGPLRPPVSSVGPSGSLCPPACFASTGPHLPVSRLCCRWALETLGPTVHPNFQRMGDA